MKKIFAAVIICIMAISVLAGCGADKKETVSNTGSTNTTNTTSYVKPFDMEEEELRSLYLKLKEEKSADEEFISNIEEKVYQENGFSIRNREDGFITLFDTMYNELSEFYYPIVIPEQDQIVIAYTNEYGNLCIYNVSTDRNDYFGNIHVVDDVDYIDSCANYSVEYVDGKLNLWEFGKITATAEVPTTAIYVGYSDWEGYLFRDAGDVYSVKIEKKNEYTGRVFVCEVIAHDVARVLVSNYKLNSDAWSQPLFQMEDGSVKAYCVWHGDKDAPRDDKSHLAEPTHEGGWR